MATGRPIAYDCRHFLGDRPCAWHKREGLLCTCEHYEPITQRVLIVKLDAMGDVLRTTALLPARLRAEYGLEWGLAQRVAFSAFRIGLAGLVALAPPPIRWLPHARHAYRRLKLQPA